MSHSGRASPDSLPGVVNVSQIATVDKTDLDARIGHLPTPDLTLVLQGLQILFAETATAHY